MASRILKFKIFYLLPVVVAVLLSPVALAQQPGGPTEVKKASVPKKEIQPEWLNSSKPY